MAVPAFQTDAVTNVTVNSTTMEVTKPSGLADDDVVLIGLSLDGDAAAANMDNETGWTLIASASEGTVELFVFAKRITNAAGEPTTWTVDWTGGEQGRAQAIRVSGCHTSGNFWEVGATNTGSSATITSNALTTSSDDQLAVAFHAADRAGIDGSTTIGGTGWSLVIGTPGASSGPNGSGILLGEKDIATAGTTENATSSISTEGWASVQVSLQSIAPAGGFAHSQGYIIG
jgi:hypothetical protein